MKHVLNLAQEDDVAESVNVQLAMIWQERGWGTDSPRISGAIVRHVLATVDSLIGPVAIGELPNDANLDTE